MDKCISVFDFFFYSFNKQFLDYSRQARYCDLLRAEFDAKRMSKKASGDKVGIFFFKYKIKLVLFVSLECVLEKWFNFMLGFAQAITVYKHILLLCLLYAHHMCIHILWCDGTSGIGDPGQSLAWVEWRHEGKAVRVCAKRMQTRGKCILVLTTVSSR